MKVYNLILADIKPLVGVSKLHYADAFESDFSLLLREMESTTLTAMFKDALEVEANLMASGKIKQKAETYRRKVREQNQASTSYSIDAKFDVMMNHGETYG